MAGQSEMGTAVIGALYCLPSTSQFTLQQTQRRSKNWSVTDANQAVIFSLVRYNTNSSRWRFPKYETQLVDAKGNILARIPDKKHTRTWKVLGGDSNAVFFSAKDRGGLLYWKTALKVFLASNLSERQPDYTVELKKIYGRDYIILHGTQPVAEVEVNAKWFGRPQYTMTVNAGADCAFVFLLAMLMEKRAQESSSASGGAGGGFGGGGFGGGGGC